MKGKLWGGEDSQALAQMTATQGQRSAVVSLLQHAHTPRYVLGINLGCGMCGPTKAVHLSYVESGQVAAILGLLPAVQVVTSLLG